MDPRRVGLGLSLVCIASLLLNSVPQDSTGRASAFYQFLYMVASGVVLAVNGTAASHSGTGVTLMHITAVTLGCTVTSLCALLVYARDDPATEVGYAEAD